MKNKVTILCIGLLLSGSVFGMNKRINKIIQAVVAGNLDKIKSLIPHSGIKSDKCKLELVPDYERYSFGEGVMEIIHLAARYGHTNIVKYLVQEIGMDAEAKDGFGKTPLHWAAGNGFFETVKYLVQEAKASAEVRDCMQNSPLCLASLRGHLEIVQYLQKWKSIESEYNKERAKLTKHIIYKSMEHFLQQEKEKDKQRPGRKKHLGKLEKQHNKKTKKYSMRIKNEK